MAIKKVTVAEWEDLTGRVNTLETRMTSLEGRVTAIENQLAMSPGQVGQQGTAPTPTPPPPAPGTTTGTPPQGAGPSPSVDERVDALEEARRKAAAGDQLLVTALSPNVGSPPKAPMNRATGERMPALPDPPPNSMSGYPAMSDNADKQPGFYLATAGDEYKWVGGDSSRVIFGDRRTIVNGQDVVHVNSTRTTQIGGFVKTENRSGTHTETWGPVSQIIHAGPQSLVLHGSQTVEIDGGRDVTSKGWRSETNLGGRHELWTKVKLEEGFGEKNEVVVGAKTEEIFALRGTVILGAKVENVTGASVVVGKAAGFQTFPNLGRKVAGAAKWVAGKLKYEAPSISMESSGTITLKASRIILDAPVTIKKSVIIDKDLDVAGETNANKKYLKASG